MKIRLFLALCVTLGIFSNAGSTEARAFTLGVALASDSNPFYIEVKKGIEAKAKELGWQLSYVSANEVAAAQNDGIGDLISRGVDAIIVSPIDSRAVIPAYDAALRAQIPIVSVVRTVQSPSQRVAVTGNFHNIGIDVGKWLAKKIGGSGKVAMLEGPSGAELFRTYSEGFEEGVTSGGGISIVFRQEGPITREFGLRMTEDMLVAHPDIDGIFSANDELALGAAQAVAAAGKKDQVIITGSNAVPAALRAVSSGALDLTVDLQPQVWGALGVTTVDRLIKGEELPPVIDIEYALIDATNIGPKLSSNE